MANLYPKYFNQNTIIIHRDMPEKGKGKDRPFIVAHQDNIVEAMNELDGTSFKVYMLFLFNQNGFVVDYSPQHISNAIGMSRDSARAAIKKMEDKGFLIRRSEGNYDFYEMSRPQPTQTAANDNWGDGW